MEPAVQGGGDRLAGRRVPQARRPALPHAAEATTAPCVGTAIHVVTVNKKGRRVRKRFYYSAYGTRAGLRAELSPGRG